MAQFSGHLAFLSNMYIFTNPIQYEGDNYISVEHAYQAAKTIDREARTPILQCPSAYEAKRLGRSLSLRSGWDRLKLVFMTSFVTQKFINNPDLMQLLLHTPDEVIIEKNSWGDTYWGICHGVGEDNLGKILRKIKADHKENDE